MYDGEKHLIVDEDLHTAIKTVAGRLKKDMKILTNEIFMKDDDIKAELKAIAKVKEKRKK